MKINKEINIVIKDWNKILGSRVTQYDNGLIQAETKIRVRGVIQTIHTLGQSFCIESDPDDLEALQIEEEAELIEMLISLGFDRREAEDSF